METKLEILSSNNCSFWRDSSFSCVKPYCSNCSILYCSPFFLILTETFPRQEFFHEFEYFCIFFQEIRWTNVFNSNDVFHQIWLVVPKHICKTFQGILEKVEIFDFLFGDLWKKYLSGYYAAIRKVHVQIKKKSFIEKFSKWKSSVRSRNNIQLFDDTLLNKQNFFFWGQRYSTTHSWVQDYLQTIILKRK